MHLPTGADADARYDVLLHSRCEFIISLRAVLTLTVTVRDCNCYRIETKYNPLSQKRSSSSSTTSRSEGGIILGTLIWRENSRVYYYRQGGLFIAALHASQINEREEKDQKKVKSQIVH